MYYKLDTPAAGSSRHSSRETNHRESPGTPPPRALDARKPPPSPRATEKGVAGTPPSPPGKANIPKADEVLEARHAEALEELAALERMLSLQARVQEESHTSARVATRSEFQTFEFAQ